jgi:hypothetical protein
MHRLAERIPHRGRVGAAEVTTSPGPPRRLSNAASAKASMSASTGRVDSRFFSWSRTPGGSFPTCVISVSSSRSPTTISESMTMSS